MKKNIAIVAGGDSSEWVVSMRSAQGLSSFIDSEKYNIYVVTIRDNQWLVNLSDGTKSSINRNDFSFENDDAHVKFDFAYITIHGTPGENGILQGYFDLINIPYSSCGVLAAAITFNKYVCNRYLSGFGIKVAKSVLLRHNHTKSVEDIVAEVGLPCFVKSNVGGSSFGVSKVKEVSKMQTAIDNAFIEGKEVIIESFISGTEVTCGCYKTKEKSVVFPITEVISKNEFFDFEAKYNSTMAEEITPARISQELTASIQKTTSEIYDLLDCKGIIRADYIIAEDGVYLLEVNTTPGMTQTSFIPQQVKAAGLNIKEVMTDIIENEL
ncbi:MAG: D-alanine--D-alanine ligase [Bacteroidales bacterium]|nr:D-alanine--D-alanine ligase [Bacteroidales bacterium]